MEKLGSKNIGLLGGSFNPAHEGHIYISLKAIELLDLDEVWWLVTPCNPLKENSNNYQERLECCKKLTDKHKKILISDFENKNLIKYSFETIEKITYTYPNNNFIWLIGADNLVNFDKWKNWETIFYKMKIAIVDRDNYKSEALNSLAAKKYKEYIIKDCKDLTTSSTPAWSFLEIEKHPQSSTNIRNKKL